MQLPSIKLTYESVEDWNSVTLSLATHGGFIISHGNICSIHIQTPKLNPANLVLENTHIIYELNKRDLNKLFDEINYKRYEIDTITNEENLKKSSIDKEIEDALTNYHGKKKKKKIADETDIEFTPTDESDPRPAG